MIQKSLFSSNKNIDSDIPGIIKELPKIDLHRHLLGSITIKTFILVSNKYSIPLPAKNEIELEQLITITKPVDGLRELFRPYRFFSKLLISPEIFTILLYEALRAAAEENIKYAEIRTSWGITGNEKFSVRAYLNSLTEAITKAEKEFDIKGRIILGITRHILGNQQYSQKKLLLERILKNAIDFKDFCVVGFDLSGVEDNYPPLRFKSFFNNVKQEGFKVTIHCGETTSFTNIWEAITELKADRISHGISAVDSEKVMQYLLKEQIPLEICPTSNVLSKAVDSLKEHPLRQFHERKMKVTINTDNPGIFMISLNREYYKLLKELNFSYLDIKKTIQNAADASFAPLDLKNEIKQNITKSLNQLSLEG